jgi:hypothetical protein
MTDLAHLDRPEQTLRWAREALGEFHAIAVEFFKSQPYAMFPEVDPISGRTTVVMRLVKPLPDALARKATEALQGTKNAFDQIAFATHRLVGSMPKGNVHFPWADSLKDFEGRLDRFGIPQQFRDAIRCHEPYFRGNGYAGGNDGIRRLAQLANDKHTIGLSVVAHVEGIVTGDFSGSFRGTEDLRILSPEWDPVKNEMIVAILPPGVKSRGNYSHSSQVVFDETTILKGIPVDFALTSFLEMGETICKDVRAHA